MVPGERRGLLESVLNRPGVSGRARVNVLGTGKKERKSEINQKFPTATCETDARKGDNNWSASGT